MILSNDGISKAIQAGDIIITPQPPKSHLATSALDLRVGDQFWKWKKEDIGTGKIINKVISAIKLDNNENNLIDWRLTSKFEDKTKNEEELNNYEEVKILIENCLNGLKTDGYMIVCAFNSREQDLSAHPKFKPLLLKQKEYLNFFINHEIIFSSDKELHETHPHNNIPHKHSMTRLLIKK